MTNETKKPAKTLRDGNLKVAIWKNESKNGHFYSVDAPIRSYMMDENQWKETSSLSGSEPLRAAYLLQKAYDAILELQENDKQDKAAA